MLRGIRGAITVEKNEQQAVNEAVAELLRALTEENQLDVEEIGAAIFSSTPDLTCAFPAAGARLYGWDNVPLFGTVEIEHPQAPILCIRLLLLYNTELPQKAMRHVYLRQAARLRPDIAQQNE
ncbi:MAG: chorismate mutase [Sporomusaceae bacterium]|nr:chorismate mutase [Sporomusaceae bacterium]